MSEPRPAVDLVLETETGDPLGREDLERLAEMLSQTLRGDVQIAFAGSAVEMHGEPWWMCVHVWCLSERALGVRPEIATAGLEWARLWRQGSERRRPVYLALADANGKRIEALLVREDERRLSAPSGRRRAFPILAGRYEQTERR